MLRDLSLITRRGGLQNRMGRQVQFYPSEKGEGQTSFSHVEGGGEQNRFWGSFNMGA